MKNKIITIILAVLLLLSIAFNVYIASPYIFGKAHYGDTILVYTNFNCEDGKQGIYDMRYSVDIRNANDTQCSFRFIDCEETALNPGYHGSIRMNNSCYEAVRDIVNDSDLTTIENAEYMNGRVTVNGSDLEYPVVVVINSAVYTCDNNDLVEVFEQYENIANTYCHLGVEIPRE